MHIILPHLFTYVLLQDFLTNVRNQAVGIGEVAMHQAQRHSTVDLSQDVCTPLQQGVDIDPEVCAADLVDFSPVYRCLHIFSVLVGTCLHVHIHMCKVILLHLVKSIITCTCTTVNHQARHTLVGQVHTFCSFLLQCYILPPFLMNDLACICETHPYIKSIIIYSCLHICHTYMIYLVLLL